MNVACILYGDHFVHLYVYLKPSITPAYRVVDNRIFLSNSASFLYFTTFARSLTTFSQGQRFDSMYYMANVLRVSTKNLLFSSPPSDWCFWVCVSKLWATTFPLSLVDWPQWKTLQMCFWSGRLNLLLLLSIAMVSTTPPESVMNGAMASHGDYKELAAGTLKSPAFFFCHPHTQFILHLKKIW